MLRRRPPTRPQRRTPRTRRVDEARVPRSRSTHLGGPAKSVPRILQRPVPQSCRTEPEGPQPLDQIPDPSLESRNRVRTPIECSEDDVHPPKKSATTEQTDQFGISRTSRGFPAFAGRGCRAKRLRADWRRGREQREAVGRGADQFAIDFEAPDQLVRGEVRHGRAPGTNYGHVSMGRELKEPLAYERTSRRVLHGLPRCEGSELPLRQGEKPLVNGLTVRTPDRHRETRQHDR